MTADSAVTTTARTSRRSTKYSRNTAGVSLTAIARPSSRPRGHGVRLGTQSAITSVINTTLIWPNAKLDRIGSRYTTAGATSAAASQARCCQVAATCSRVSTMVTDAISSTSVVAVIAALAAGRVSQANGANAIAASGG